MEKFLGHRLKQLRESKHISQEYLADKAEVRQGEISHLENGRNNNPSGSKVIRIAKVLGVDPAYFYCEDIVTFNEVFGIPPEDEQDIPYIKLSKEARRSGVPLKVLEQIIKSFGDMTGKK